MAFEIRDRNPAGAWLGEGPLWLPDHREFLWLDMPRHEVHRFDPRSAEDRVIADGFDEKLACLVRLSDGFVLLVGATGLYRLNPESGSTTRLAAPLVPDKGTEFNDGKVAPDGALWLGISDVEESEPTGSLYRISCIRRGVRRPRIRHRQRTGLLSRRKRGVLRRLRGRENSALCARCRGKAGRTGAVRGDPGRGGCLPTE